MKTNSIHTSFTSGELSPRLYGRVDLDQYRNAAAKLTNMIVMPQGGVYRRSGTRYANEIKDSENYTILVRFEYSTLQAYVLEFGAGYIRFYRNHGLLEQGGDISAYTLVSGGTRYAAGTVNLSSNDGTITATAVAAVDANGTITGLTSFTPGANVPGSGLIMSVTGPAQVAAFRIVSLVPTSLAGVSSHPPTSKTGSFTIKNSSGSIATAIAYINQSSYIFNITSGGYGFTLGEPVTIYDSNNSPVTNATVSAVTGTNTQGAIQSISIINGGAGYASGPTTLVTATGETVAVNLTVNGNGTVTAVALAGSSSSNFFANQSLSIVGDVATASNASISVVSFNPLSVYEVASPYTQDDLDELNFTQSADTLYIFHPSYPPRKLLRYGAINWSLVQIQFQDGPYLSLNSTSTTLAASATSGAGASITITASADLFVSTDVGRWIRIKSGSVWGVAQVTSVTDTKHVLATVLYPFKDTSAQTAWRLGAFGTALGYPACGCFHQQRLALANTTTQPQTVWLSMSGNFETFSPTDMITSPVGSTDPDNTQTLDSSAITYSIASSTVNAILWIVSARDLLLGTSSGEWIATGGSSSLFSTAALTPSSFVVVSQTTNGSEAIAPGRANYSTIFIQRGGQHLLETAYNFTVDNYDVDDLSILSEHLVREGGGIVDLAYQQMPDGMFWMIRADGRLIGMTFLKNQKVIAFTDHHIAGTYQGGNAVVESICTIPAPGGTSDELWMIVKRTVNGRTVRYIEYLEQPFIPENDQDKDSMYFVDCGLSFSGDPTLTFFGLDHLEGQSLAVVADGAYRGEETVSAGVISLDRAGSLVHAGLPFFSEIRTLRPEAGGSFGTSQGQKKRYNKAIVRVDNSLFLKYGVNRSRLINKPFREKNDALGMSPPLFSGDVELSLDDSYTRDGWFWIVQDAPYPLTVLSIMPQGEVYDAG